MNNRKKGFRDLLRPTYRKYFRTIVRPLKLNLERLAYKSEHEKRIEGSKEYLRTLRDIHSGQRCFIIGNGPSLKSKDLDMLQKDVCFGVNKIYKIFDKTEWRPTYYFISDIAMIKSIKNEIADKIKGNKFICINDFTSCPKMHDVIYVNQIEEDSYPNMPSFSEDISQCVYSGATVTYICVQSAVYMGFKEIYLLGIDHSYSSNLNPDGTLEYYDNVKDYFLSNEKVVSHPRIQDSTLAYQAAKKYADGHDVKIYNATRGGKLEIFERVDFDALF